MRIAKIPKDTLNYWFSAKDLIFADFKKKTLEYEDKLSRRIFIDRGSKILFIAHLDTVQTPLIKKITKDRIYAQGLDDRLGCYTVYKLSKQLDVDLLLTDNEELGQSTAESHVCKDYNWIAEFDRGGIDAVSYGLDNPEFLGALKPYFKIGLGSFSDIAFLDTTSCCINIGIAYEHAHSEDSYMDLKLYKEQIQKFTLFFNRYKDTEFIADKKFKESVFGSYNVNQEFVEVVECEWCGNPDYEDDMLQVGDYKVCVNCIDDVENYYFECGIDVIYDW